MGTRTTYGVALLCTLWTGWFLVPEGAIAALALPLGLAVLFLGRAPVIASVAVAALVFAVFASGVPEDNPACLAPGFVSAFALGRRVPGLVSFASLLLLVVAMVVVGGAIVADVAFITVVLTVFWGVGRVVWRRARLTDDERRTAVELADLDPEEVAAAVVRDERARLAGDVLTVIRRAVESMQKHAASAGSDLDPDRLAVVQKEGRSAVAELRRLLGLLRTELDNPADPSHEQPPRWRATVPDMVLTIALVATVFADSSLADSGSSGELVMTLVFAAAAGLARLDPPIALAVASAPAAVTTFSDLAMVTGFSTFFGCALLAWWAGVDGRKRTLAAFGVFAVAELATIRADNPGNEAIVLGTLVVAAFAGWTWRSWDRAGSAASARAVTVRERHKAATEHAVRAERLRLARELHDVVSHAVGVMVLQIGAALALRTSDPDSAREAVRTAQAAGSDALAELADLHDLLEAGAVGPMGLGAQPVESDLPHAIESLALRVGATGLDVRLELGRTDGLTPALAATVYRIAQESLTNAARHAPGCRVDLSLVLEDPWLKVTVRNGGGVITQTRFDGDGYGLVGLAERVRIVGGSMTAGATPDGGFSVEARMPLVQPQEAPA